jgi:hypothetical protein
MEGSPTRHHAGLDLVEARREVEGARTEREKKPLLYTEYKSLYRIQHQFRPGSGES